MTAPKLVTKLEFEVHLLNEIFEKYHRKGERTIEAYVDDSSNPYDSYFNREEIINGLCADGLFSIIGFEQFNEKTDDYLNGDFVVATYVKVVPRIRKLTETLKNKKQELKWESGNGILQRGVLSFDPLTGELKIGKDVVVFRKKQLEIIKRLIEEGVVSCSELYRMIYPNDLKSKLSDSQLSPNTISVMKRDLDESYFKGIKNKLLPFQKKLKLPALITSSGVNYELNI